MKIRELFKTKIIWQIVPVLLVVLIPSFIIGGYLAYRQALNLCLVEEQEDISHAGDYVELELTRNPNFEWLLSYWSNNPDAVNAGIVYDSKESLYSLRNKFAALNPGLSEESLSPDVLESLSEESKLLYAQIYLLEDNFVLNQMKASYNLKFIYLAKLKSEDEALFLLSGFQEGDKRGSEMTDIFMLGKDVNPNFEYHPVLKEIYETGAAEDPFEKKLKKGRTGLDYNVYVPFSYEDGVYYLCCCKAADSVLVNVYRGLHILGVAFLLILTIGIVLMIIAFKEVLLKPLSVVQKQIRKYTDDKNSDHLVSVLKKIETENEIGSLSKDFSSLVVELDRYTGEITKLTAENERIETELNLAKNIQMAALPTKVPVFEKHQNFEIAGKMKPAKEVGGDFFDYFKIDDDHLAILIGDVSGKGVPAAMFMMFSHICVKNMASTLENPAEIFMRVNNVLIERNVMEMFVTAWLGIMDLRTGEIKCVNAGHENPAIYKDGKFDLYKTKHGLVLAAMEDAPYKTETIKLEKGDKLFVYTDGVAEATNSDNEMYGTNRMIEALNNVSGEDCENILKYVKRDVDKFVGSAPQFDDLTMVCLSFE